MTPPTSNMWRVTFARDDVFFVPRYPFHTAAAKEGAERCNLGWGDWPARVESPEGEIALVTVHVERLVYARRET